MRTFEIALILANLLALILGLKRQPKWFWTAATAANLLALFLHAYFEGLRYQMAFVYVFVPLAAVFAAFKTSDRFYESRMPAALKVMAAGVGLIGLGLTVLAASALPVFRLPEPAGEDAVGVQYFHLTDEARAEPFLDGSNRKRELMVKVYYPAEEDESKPYMRYFNSPELVRAFAGFYHMPAFLFDHFNLVTTHSKEGLQVSGRQGRYPVVLFSHGAGASMEVLTAQSEDLASRGYIVAAIDHTYASAATAFPSRVVNSMEATTDFNTADPAELITQIMADDARFVIDRLVEMDAGESGSIFAGRLDLDQIGAIGHSVGGAVAYQLAIQEARVKAAINLDGVVYVAPEGVEEVAPFLMLASDSGHAQMIQTGESLIKKIDEMSAEELNRALMIYGSREVYVDAYEKAQRNIQGLTEVLGASGSLYTIEGSDHMKFTDIGLFFGLQPLREMMNIRGETSPARCIEITQAVTAAFFDEHLKGEMGLDLGYAELKRVEVR